jgi:hypothetical protein
MSIEISCQGWLEKKKKQRYFVLAGSDLYWFLQVPSFGGKNFAHLKQNNSNSNDLSRGISSKVGNDQNILIDPKEECKEAKGVMYLSRCSICLDPEKSHCILVTNFSQRIAIEVIRYIIITIAS